MAAPTSPVAICNLALDHLKQGTVTNIEAPTTTTAVICARWYDTTRRAVLRKHTWSFAKTRRSLSRNSTAPSFGYADAYNLPNDFVRLRSIGDDSIGDYKQLTQPYEIEGDQILINNNEGDSLDITYIKDEILVTKFDPLFVDLLAVELALRMSYKFTLKNTVIVRLNEMATILRAEAKSVNGQDRPPRRVERSKYRRARRSLTSNVAGPITVFPA